MAGGQEGDYLVPIQPKARFSSLYPNLLSIPVDSGSQKAEESNSGSKVYDHNLVRTDSREQTLHAFLPPGGKGKKRFDDHKMLHIYIIIVGHFLLESAR